MVKLAFADTQWINLGVLTSHPTETPDTGEAFFYLYDNGSSLVAYVKKDSGSTVQIAALPGDIPTSIGDMSDVDLTGIVDGQTIVWDTSGFVPGDVGTGGSGGNTLKHILVAQIDTGYGTNGPGWFTKAMTNILLDDTSAVSLSSGDVVLPAGTYRFRGNGTGMRNAATFAGRLQLYNVTDAVAFSAQFSPNVYTNTASQIVQFSVEGKFTIASSKTVRLQQYHSALAYDRVGITDATLTANNHASVLFEKIE